MTLELRVENLIASRDLEARRAARPTRHLHAKVGLELRGELIRSGLVASGTAVLDVDCG